MLRGSRVLVVHRVPEQLDTVRQLLSAAECCVTAAASTRKARTLLAKEPPELILLEMGCAALAGEAPGVPVIYILPGDDPAAIRRAYSLGGQDYVSEPIAKNVLLARVETQLENVRLEQALDRRSAEVHRFCMNVAHDLKAPFTIIPTLVEMLSGELPDSGGPVGRLMADVSRNAAEVRLRIEGVYDRTKKHEPHITD